MKIRFVFFRKNIDLGEFQHETTKTREGARFVSFSVFSLKGLVVEVICFVCTVNRICIQVYNDIHIYIP